MSEDSRITVETVQRHVTPDGRRFDTVREAESHLAHLDRKAREERVKNVLESAFWQDDALQERFEHSSSDFSEKAFDLIESHLDLLIGLAPMLPDIKAAWDGPKAPEPEKPATPAPGARPTRRTHPGRSRG